MRCLPHLMSCLNEIADEEHIDYEVYSRYDELFEIQITDSLNRRRSLYIGFREAMTITEEQFKAAVLETIRKIGKQS